MTKYSVKLKVYGKGEHICKKCFHYAVCTYQKENNPIIECSHFIELPPHGRLIDADALKDKWIWGDTDRLGHTEVIEVIDIDDAPTIIEAEPDCATCPVKGKACKVFYRDKGDLSVCRELRKVEGEE